MVENQIGKSIKILWLDKGGEYTSRFLSNTTRKMELCNNLQYHNTPQKNGVAKRKNRTLHECAHSLLKSKGISNSFWVEAINTTVYLKNKSPTKYLEHKIPFKSFYGFFNIQKYCLECWLKNVSLNLKIVILLL